MQVLKDDTSVADNNISETGFLVILVQKVRATHTVCRRVRESAGVLAPAAGCAEARVGRALGCCRNAAPLSLSEGRTTDYLRAEKSLAPRLSRGGVLLAAVPSGSRCGRCCTLTLTDRTATWKHTAERRLTQTATSRTQH